MPLSVEVRDGQVVAMVDQQGQPVTEFQDSFLPYASIDKLFDTLEKAQNGGADKVTVEYDSQRGYPSSIYIDYIEQAADDEMSFTVSGLEVLQ